MQIGFKSGAMFLPSHKVGDVSPKGSHVSNEGSVAIYKYHSDDPAEIQGAESRARKNNVPFFSVNMPYSSSHISNIELCDIAKYLDKKTNMF